MWTPEHLEWIFDSTRPIPLEHSYASHLWERTAVEYLKDLTPGRVRAKESNFHSWAKPLLAGIPDDFGAPANKRHLWRLPTDKMIESRQIIKDKAEHGFARASLATKRLLMTPDQLRRHAFQQVYKQNLWGTEGNSKFFSGIGSRGPATERYVEAMADLLAEHARDLGRPIMVVDIGCGDFAVGRALVERLPDLIYIGCDIVPELIAYNSAHFANERVSFRRLDVVCDALPDGDVCLIRQVFQHLPNADILAAVQRLDYPIAYVTEAHPLQRLGPVNPDKLANADVRFNWRLGQGRGVELDQPPYSLHTQEMFRFTLPPCETIVTERVELPAATFSSHSRAGMASAI